MLTEYKNIYKNTKLYTNLQIYCDYHKKNINDILFQFRDRERQSLIQRGSISLQNIALVEKQFRLSTEEILYMLKYDLSDSDCRWHFFSKQLNVYDEKMDLLEESIAARQFFLKNANGYIREEKYLRLLNILDPYKNDCIDNTIVSGDRIKIALFTIDFIKAHLFVEKVGEEYAKECEIHIKFPTLQRDVLTLTYDDFRWEQQVTEWDEQSLNLLMELNKIVPENEYYFTLPLKKVLTSSYKYSLRNVLGISE